MLDQCPGAINMRTPTLTLRNCPRCGAEVEIFSTNKKETCGACGFIIYNEVASCIQWCEYAKECVGEELYNQLKIKTPEK